MGGNGWNCAKRPRRESSGWRSIATLFLVVGIVQLASIQSAAASFRVDIPPVDAREAKEIPPPSLKR